MVDKTSKLLLDAIAYAEGHGKRLSYDASYAHGKYTDGAYPSRMTLDNVRKLQDKMVAQQTGKLKSSAIGRYQFIRKTFDRVRKALQLPGNTRFSAATQDKMAAYLLVERGYLAWLSGSITTPEFQHRLAKEWASIPDPFKGGKSYHGQGVGISQDEMNWVFAEMKRPYKEEVEDTPISPRETPTTKTSFPYVKLLLSLIFALVIAWFTVPGFRTFLESIL